MLALVLLCGIWAWWGWQKGAYFGTVMLPGLIVLCIGAALLIRFAPWRLRLRLSTPIVVALSALLGLALWELLSALWTPAPDIAISNAQRIFVYAIAFGLGVLLCNLLGRRMNLSFAPLAFAGLFVGLMTALHLVFSSDTRALLESDGTLSYPLGYRNAEAAFFAIAMFPAICLAIDPTADRRLRAGSVAVATLCIDLIILAQSRASLPALVVALVVFALASPRRVRALSWLALALVAALPTVPAMSALFTASGDGVRGVAGEMHTAGLVTLLTTAVAGVLGWLAVRNEKRLPGLGSTSGLHNRTVVRAMIGTAVALFLGLLVATGGNPIGWAGDRIDEFKHAGTPDLSAEGSRFGFNAGSNRYDAWRVALSDFGDDPVFGDGGGGYRYSYLVKRNSTTQTLHDAHSVEFELLSELGLPGFALLVTAVVAAFAGALRVRQLGPSARLLSAGALASASYWIVHTSVDWFWPYTAVTAPVLALLGSAAAPSIRAVGRRSTRGWRIWVTAGLAVLALSAVAPFLADRYVNAATEGWQTDPQSAIADLNHAHDLNRFDDFPLLLKGRIQSQTGDTEGALTTYREAADLRPEEYATHYLIAELEADANPGLAQNEIRVALELNPLDPQVRRLAMKLGIPESQLAPLPGS